LSVQDFLFGCSETALNNSLEWSNATADELLEEMRKWRRIGPLGKAHNIALHTRKTPARIKRFRELSGGVLLKRDNSTRWNSWNNLLESLLRQNVRNAIEIYIDENSTLEDDRLERREWKLLEKIQKILVLFKLATKAMEGHQATLTHLLPSLDFLLNTYSQALTDNREDRILSSMIRMGWEKLDKYFSATDRSPVYIAVVVLNPKFKWRYFELKWDRDWVRDGKQKLKQYWLNFVASKEEEDRGNADTIIVDENNFGGHQRSTPSTEVLGEEENHFWAWMDLRSTGIEARDDYERYCSNSEPETSIGNPLL